MDWIALASVISTGVVATLTLILNAATKRGDRKHASSLDFEKRVWDIKSSALLTAIATCDSIRSLIRIGDKGDMERLQAAIFHAFETDGFAFANPELVAYAAHSVNEPVTHLQEIMHQAMLTDALAYSPRITKLRKEKEDAIDRGEFELAATLRNSEVDANKMLGRASGIDIATVESLCNTIVERARNDLRGKDVKL